MKVSESSPPSPAPATEGEWDEDRLEAALDQLKIQHIEVWFLSCRSCPPADDLPQLRQLRETIPDLIRPLRTDHASPEVLYATFAKGAASAADHVRDFQTLMRSLESDEVRTWAATSRRKNPDGILDSIDESYLSRFGMPVRSGKPKPEEANGGSKPGVGEEATK